MSAQIVKVGQIWEDNDARDRLSIRRHIRVTAVHVTAGKASCVNILTGRETQIRLDRFKGKRTGYTLVEDVPDA